MPQKSTAGNVLSMVDSESMGSVHGFNFEPSDVLHRNNFTTAQSFPRISNDNNNFTPTFDVNLDTSPMFDGNTFASTQLGSNIFDLSLDLDTGMMFDGCNFTDVPLIWDGQSLFLHQE